MRSRSFTRMLSTSRAFVLATAILLAWPWPQPAAAQPGTSAAPNWTAATVEAELKRLQTIQANAMKQQLTEIRDVEPV